MCSFFVKKIEVMFHMIYSWVFFLWLFIRDFPKDFPKENFPSRIFPGRRGCQLSHLEFLVLGSGSDVFGFLEASCHCSKAYRMGPPR